MTIAGKEMGASMKRAIACIIIAVGLLTREVVQAQGTVYLSNLKQSSTGSRAVGSDSWLAVGFKTGTNAAAYLLDSIQLAMVDGSGNPSGFRVMVYSAIGSPDVAPGSSLDTLNGSLNPVAGGIYAYTPPSSLTLLPSTFYFIVLTGGTAVANGGYEWSLASSNYSPSGGWRTPVFGFHFDSYQSSDGSSWDPHSFFPQFAVTATDVPEPGVLSLFVLGGLGLLWHRQKVKTLQ